MWCRVLFPIRAGLFLILSLLATACVPPKLPLPSAATAPQLKDLHERLSYVIRKHGFEHGIMSRRTMTHDIDAIYIPLPLDTLKRQHDSLENLIQELAAICKLPQYDEIKVLIELGTKDKTDREYLKTRVAEAMAGQDHVRVESNPETFNDITITITHQRLGLQ